MIIKRQQKELKNDASSGVNVIQDLQEKIVLSHSSALQRRSANVGRTDNGDVLFRSKCASVLSSKR